jgi:origin recognition complex subunit 6
MCTVMETRQAIPHVIAGVESMLRLPKTLPTGKEESPLQPGNKTPALIAATWFFVLQEFSGKDITGSEFRERRTKIMKVFKDIKNDKVIAAKITGDVDEFWESWEDIEPMDVQAWIAAVTERDWLEMDWFTNIGKPEDQGPLGESNNHMDAQEFDTSSSLGKRRRIGRMMQDEYDYLSPENKAEYQHWKENILAQIDDLIAGGVMDTTDG